MARYVTLLAMLALLGACTPSIDLMPVAPEARLALSAAERREMQGHCVAQVGLGAAVEDAALPYNGEAYCQCAVNNLASYFSRADWAAFRAEGEPWHRDSRIARLSPVQGYCTRWSIR